MTVLFIEYPKCSTCKKAKRWLDELFPNGITSILAILLASSTQAIVLSKIS